MTHRSTLFLLPVLPLLAAGLTAVQDAVGPDTAAVAPAGPAAAFLSPPDLDSARAEMAVGRYWHAARHLRDLRASGAVSFGPAETLLLARAEAGYLNWEGVVETLEGRPWLADEGEGLGLRLLGRGFEAAEAWAAAETAYASWLETPHAAGSADAVAIRVRRARALARLARLDEALAVLDDVEAPALVAWTALGEAERLASEGDTAAVRRLAARLEDETARERGWELEATSLLAAGDTARATSAYRSLEGRVDDRRLGHLRTHLGDLALAARDTPAAVRYYRASLDAASGGSPAVRATARLFELDRLEGDALLEAARRLDRGGEDGLALRAWDRWLQRSGGSLGEDDRLARARIMAVTSGRHDEAVTEFRALSTSESQEIGAAALDSWAALRSRQGRTGDVETLRGWLVERYPASPQAVERVFFRGDAAHDRLDLDAALEEYGRLQEMEPSLSYSGLARMRMGQIHLQRRDTARAISSFRSYLEQFPEGRRWEEASYWAGRLLLEGGQTEEGATLLRRILDDAPLSYYAVMASDLLDRPYEPPREDAGSGSGASSLPAWAADELRLLDLMEAAGLDEGRTARATALLDRVADEPGEVALQVGEAFLERDLTLEAINLGWALRERGRPWSLRLLRLIYPFPYREMVERVASERGLDPLLIAALIRQESAFDRDIVSSAGAVGLMQVMPETGRQVARAEGPDDYHPRSLTTPEINLHLGSLYLKEMLERYDGDLTLVLSAYNAGPARATRWRAFPEAADPLRFTERIPFSETRDYVKLVRRNRALYEALHREDS